MLSLYADDCTIFLSYKESDLRNTIDILTNFYRVSGLEIHLGKTQCVRIGENPEALPILCEDIGITWAQEFKLLGVLFNATTLNYNVNFDLKLDEIIKETKNWRHRFLTAIGKSVIAKTLLLSKINHLVFVLPSLSKKRLKEIESVIYSFIWGGKIRTRWPGGMLLRTGKRAG